jgi:8-amino-7-oxononanoate synthase
MESRTPIQPLLAGDSRRALEWSRFLETNGVLVAAIRPPTVPEGAARLRITLSAAHQEADIDRLLELLARLPDHKGRVPRAEGHGRSKDIEVGE